MGELGPRLGHQPDLAIRGEHGVDGHEPLGQCSDRRQVLQRPVPEQGNRQLDLLAVAVDVGHHAGAPLLRQLIRGEVPLVRARWHAEVVHPRAQPALTLGEPLGEELLRVGEVVGEDLGIVAVPRPLGDLLVVAGQPRLAVPHAPGQRAANAGLHHCLGDRLLVSDGARRLRHRRHAGSHQLSEGDLRADAHVVLGLDGLGRDVDPIDVREVLDRALPAQRLRHVVVAVDQPRDHVAPLAADPLGVRIPLPERSRAADLGDAIADDRHRPAGDDPPSRVHRDERSLDQRGHVHSTGA